MPYHPHILSAIGRTPLVRLNKVVGPDDATVLVKLEYMNPGGAIKDRMALHIIEKAERAGILKPGATIVENTSGNTGRRRRARARRSRATSACSRCPTRCRRRSRTR